jgi:hypothetical protein
MRILRGRNIFLFSSAWKESAFLTRMFGHSYPKAVLGNSVDAAAVYCQRNSVIKTIYDTNRLLPYDTVICIQAAFGPRRTAAAAHIVTCALSLQGQRPLTCFYQQQSPTTSLFESKTSDQ